MSNFVCRIYTFPIRCSATWSISLKLSFSSSFFFAIIWVLSLLLVIIYVISFWVIFNIFLLLFSFPSSSDSWNLFVCCFAVILALLLLGISRTIKKSHKKLCSIFFPAHHNLNIPKWSKNLSYIALTAKKRQREWERERNTPTTTASLQTPDGPNGNWN